MNESKYIFCMHGLKTFRQEGGWQYSLRAYQFLIYGKIVSEYDQEIPQSQTADKPMASHGSLYEILREV